MPVYINGKFIEEENAVISVNDRSFRYGDGLFETVRVFSHTPYLIEEHIQRLQNGAKALKIEKIPEANSIIKSCLQLIRKNKISEGSIRITISRGVGSNGYMPEKTIKPNLIIQTGKLPKTSEKAYILGISSYKQIPLSCLPTNYKINNSLGYVLSIIEAKNKKFDEAILLDLDGNISETSSSNIFWVKDKKVYTSHLSTGCLEGITRRKIINIAGAKEVKSDINSLLEADEIFLTNSVKGIIPVKSIKPYKKNWHSFEQIKKIKQALENDIKLYVKKNKAKLG